jgi:hypothetical protein
MLAEPGLPASAPGLLGLEVPGSAGELLHVHEQKACVMCSSIERFRIQSRKLVWPTRRMGTNTAWPMYMVSPSDVMISLV